MTTSLYQGICQLPMLISKRACCDNSPQTVIKLCASFKFCMTYNITSKKILILTLEKTHVVFHIKFFVFLAPCMVPALLIFFFFFFFFFTTLPFTRMLRAFICPWTFGIVLLTYVSEYSDPSYRYKPSISSRVANFHIPFACLHCILHE